MIYFDHNASTPVRPEVAAAMAAATSDLHANPSSMHREGQLARAAIERARAQVAALVNAAPSEIVFTSGGTEADHAGIIGAAWGLESQGRRIAVSMIEHHAVHGAGEVLARCGWEIGHLAVTPSGVVDPGPVIDLEPRTALVSLMLANNETGAVQPVAAVASRAHERGILVHCDAVQAAGKIPVDIASLDVDYLVISAHKLGGPKGVGALIVRTGSPFEPLFRGSGHERGRRGGTENLPGIVGFGVATELAVQELSAGRDRMLALRTQLERGIRAALPDAVIHAAGVPRLPNTVNLSVPGARSDHMLMALDARGIAVSAGAACASGAVEPSPVLAAMGVSRELAVCAIRLSMGRTSTEAEVEAVIAGFIEAVGVARAQNGAATVGGTA